MAQLHCRAGVASGVGATPFGADVDEAAPLLALLPGGASEGRVLIGAVCAVPGVVGPVPGQVSRRRPPPLGSFGLSIPAVWSTRGIALHSPSSRCWLHVA